MKKTKKIIFLTLLLIWIWLITFTVKNFLEYNSFPNIKKEILLDLEREKIYTREESVKKQIESSIETLTNIQNETSFFSALAKEYEKIDTLHTLKFSNFEEEKKVTIEILQQEVPYIKDKKLQENIVEKIKVLTRLKDEESFYEEIEKIYSNASFEKYYGDMFDPKNFPELKERILNEYKDTFDKNTIQKLKKIQNQEVFFEEIDTLLKEKYWEEEMKRQEAFDQ